MQPALILGTYPQAVRPGGPDHARAYWQFLPRQTAGQPHELDVVLGFALLVAAEPDVADDLDLRQTDRRRLRIARSAKQRAAAAAHLKVMRTNRAEQNYRDRVARIVAVIVADPMAAHRLEDLARVANFSPYHFHRVYSSITGETVASTVRRVRLALATRLLENGAESVTQVALSVGYDSPQAFTRAFGQFTGQSPKEFQGQMHRLELNAGAARCDDVACIAPSVRIVERPSQRVYALRHRGPLATIPHTQRRLHLHCDTNTVSESLGASYGDPADAEGFRYYAAASSYQPWPVVDKDIEMLDIPAGRYALHCLAGPYVRISAAIQALYSRWLPSSGYEPDDRPTLEHYLNSPHTANQADLRTDLLIPIRSAATT